MRASQSVPVGARGLQALGFAGLLVLSGAMGVAALGDGGKRRGATQGTAAATGDGCGDSAPQQAGAGLRPRGRQQRLGDVRVRLRSLTGNTTDAGLQPHDPDDL